MTESRIEAVLAGSKGFALALLAPLAERVGARPRVASDPRQLALGDAGLVVMEFAGEDSLRTIKDLVLRNPGLRIVAAVPESHAAAEAPLRALGVELARWDGKPDAVLGAVSRRMEAPARTAPAADGSGGPARGTAPTGQRPPPLPGAPRASPAPAATALRASPGAGAPASDARAPETPKAPARAQGQGAEARSPPPAPPARVQGPSAAARAPSVPERPSSGAEPASRPPDAPVAPPAAQGAQVRGSGPAPAAVTVGRVVPPGEGAPVAVAPLPLAPRSSETPPVEAQPRAPGLARAQAPREAQEAAAAPADGPGSEPPSPAASEPRARPSAAAPRAEAGAGGLFDEEPGGDDFDLDVADEPAGAPAPAPLDAAGGAWPANLPGAAEAEAGLMRGLAGLFDPPDAPLGAVAGVVAGLSELERAVLEGRPQPFDASPIRRAAVMRVRVAAALALAPPQGGAVDASAVSALLAEIDALLSEVAALAASAPPELQPGLEAVRNALVREAIGFAEASHRGVAVDPAPAGAAAREARAAQRTRIVSVASRAEAELEHAVAKRRRGMYVALAICLAAAAAFHGYTYFATRSAEPTIGVGPLSNGIASQAPGGGRMVYSAEGAPFDRDQVRRFAEEEALKGNAVRELAPGVLMIVPGPASDAGPPALSPAEAPR